MSNEKGIKTCVVYDPYRSIDYCYGCHHYDDCAVADPKWKKEIQDNVEM